MGCQISISKYWLNITAFSLSLSLENHFQNSSYWDHIYNCCPSLSWLQTIETNFDEYWIACQIHGEAEEPGSEYREEQREPGHR